MIWYEWTNVYKINTVIAKRTARNMKQNINKT